MRVRRHQGGWGGPWQTFKNSRYQASHCRGASLTDWRWPVAGCAQGWRCGRNNTVRRSGCWRRAAFSCASPSGTRSEFRRPAAVTDRCPKRKTYLRNKMIKHFYMTERGKKKITIPQKRVNTVPYDGSGDCNGLPNILHSIRSPPLIWVCLYLL